MPVTRLDISERYPLLDGKPFASRGDSSLRRHGEVEGLVITQTFSGERGAK